MEIETLNWNEHFEKVNNPFVISKLEFVQPIILQ
jgi:hypothetical protein